MATSGGTNDVLLGQSTPNLILGGADQQAIFRLLYGVVVLKGTANVA